VILWGLVACEPTLTGAVVDDAGAPVAGASLVDGEGEGACQAVTGADGRFRTQCVAGARRFAVSHPDHLPGDWVVTPSGRGEVDIGRFTLVRVPTARGRWLRMRDGFVGLDGAALRRDEEGERQRWCVAGDAPIATVPTGRVSVLDASGAETRVYRLDAEGCAYRMQKGGAEHWAWQAERVEGVSRAISDGRAWLDLELAAGDYAVVDWFAGFLVREDAAADTWRAAWIRAE
jgi:hypothetical protein